MSIAQSQRRHAKRDECKPNRKRKPVPAPAQRNQHSRRKTPRQLAAKLSRKEEPGLFITERPAADENRQNRPQQYSNDSCGCERSMDYKIRAAVMRSGVLDRGFDFCITSGS